MYSDRNISYFTSLRSVLVNVTAPIQYAVSYPIVFLDAAITDIRSKHELLEKNAKLHAAVLFLQAKVQKQAALEQENAKLRGLASFVAKSQEKFLIAQLLAVNTNNFSQQFVLDKGQQNGVYRGQPVLDSYGLVGQVILTGLATSTILLITDAKSAIPVQINRNGARAIAVGSGDGSTLELVQVPTTIDIKTGDLLVTSGLGGRFPQGYPVGVVKNVANIAGESFAKITVTPKAHINSNRQFLLTWSKHLTNARHKNKQTPSHAKHKH